MEERGGIGDNTSLGLKAKLNKVVIISQHVIRVCMFVIPMYCVSHEVWSRWALMVATVLIVGELTLIEW